jgi:hypothetical protein
MGRGKKEKNGGSSTADQVKDQGKRLTQKFSQTERYKTYFIKKAVRPT